MAASRSKPSEDAARADRVHHQIVRFLMVGAIAFSVDAFVLWLLVYPLGVGVIVARVVSFVIAISITFVMNARFTFQMRARDSNLMRYIAIQMLGAAINFSVYSWLVLSGPLQGRPLFSFVFGAAIATFSNFTLVRRFVYSET